MIVNSTNKELRGLFVKGDKKTFASPRAERIRLILSRLNAAKDLSDMDYPGSDLHSLKKSPYRGFHSVHVSDNYRMVFRFLEGDAYDVDCLHIH